MGAAVETPLEQTLEVESYRELARVRSHHADVTRTWLRATIDSFIDVRADVRLWNHMGDIATYRVTVPRKEMGKLVGLKGRNIRALRVLLLARGGKDHMRYDVQVCE